MNTQLDIQKNKMIGPYLMKIHNQEYEFTHLDTKNYFHFCEWKEWKEACTNILYLNLEWKNTKQKHEHFILCQHLVRNLDFTIPKIAILPLH